MIRPPFPPTPDASPDENEIPTESLSREMLVATPETTRRASRQSKKSILDSNRHEAEEIVVPFDERSFSGLLVDEKTFQAAYASKRTPPQMENWRPEIRRPIGRVVRAPGLVDELSGFFSGVLLFAEILLMIWTAALLLSGFPISNWLGWMLMSAWVLALVALVTRMKQPVFYRLLLWCGGGVATCSWLAWSPWSQEVITKLSGYFFLT